MKRVLILLSMFVAGTSFAAVPKASKEITKLRSRLKDVKKEAGELESSLSALRNLRKNLKDEIAASETRFQTRFSRVLVPLLSWPKISFSSRVPGWVEREHHEMVLESLRRDLVREPLELISDRELKVRASETSVAALEDDLKKAEMKREILQIRIEELKVLERKRTRKPAQIPSTVSPTLE